MTFAIQLLRSRDVKNYINFNKTVPQGNTSANVSIKADSTNYLVLAMPSWNTTLWITNKTASGFTGNFGTAAPASAKIDYFVIENGN